MIDRFMHLDPLAQVLSCVFAGFCLFTLLLGALETRQQRRRSRRDAIIDRVMEAE